MDKKGAMKQVALDGDSRGGIPEVYKNKSGIFVCHFGFAVKLIKLNRVLY